jgi:hypothetical protein
VMEFVIETKASTFCSLSAGWGRIAACHRPIQG